MPESEETTALRRELSLMTRAHEREHVQIAKSLDAAAALAKENKADANEWRAAMNDRERNFATKADVAAILDRLDKVERAILVRDEREAVRARELAEALADQREKEAEERRRSMWLIGLIVGAASSVIAILVNTLLRLTS